MPLRTPPSYSPPSIPSHSTMSATSIESSRSTSTKASSSSSSSMTDNLKGISSSQAQSQSQSIKVQKEGMIYSPFTVEDSVMQCIGKNITRLKQGKAGYPVIVKDDNAKKQFENIRQQLLLKYTKSAETMEQSISKMKQLLANLPEKANSPQEAKQISEMTLRITSNIKKFTDGLKDSIAYRDGLKDLTVSSNEQSHVLETLTSGLHKLYITGHGFAGCGYIASTIDVSSKKSAETLAKELKQGGLKTDFNDIRTTSCESADTRAITSFDQKELEEARKPTFFKIMGYSTGILKDQPFAQELSDSFSDLGYKDMHVTGYHGSRRCLPQGLHHLQVLGEDINSLSARSSSVKHVFTPNI